MSNFCPGPLRARTYAGVDSRETCPRRKTVSMGSFTRMAADDAKNLATEKVKGEIWLSIMNRVRRIRGAESVRRGCTRELRTVGTSKIDEQR